MRIISLELSDADLAQLGAYRGNKVQLLVYRPSRFDSERVPFGSTGDSSLGVDPSERYWNLNPHLHVYEESEAITGTFSGLRGYRAGERAYPTHIMVDNTAHPIQQGSNGECITGMFLDLRSPPVWNIGSKGAFTQAPQGAEIVDLLQAA